MIKDKSLLKVGSWIMMEYGFKNRDFYVYSVIEDYVELGRKNWLVSDAEYFELNDVLRNATYLGEGKMKWYWKFLPFRDVLCPFKYYK